MTGARATADGRNCEWITRALLLSNDETSTEDLAAQFYADEKATIFNVVNP